MRGDRAQLSVEYLIIIGFAFLITVPLTMLFLTESNSTSDTITVAQAEQLTRKIVSAAEAIGYSGEPSFTTLKVSMPKNVDSIIITERELAIRLKTSAGTSDVVEFSAVNMTGNISSVAGTHFIKIQAMKGFVNITST